MIPVLRLASGFGFQICIRAVEGVVDREVAAGLLKIDRALAEFQLGYLRVVFDRDAAVAVDTAYEQFLQTTGTAAVNRMLGALSLGKAAGLDVHLQDRARLRLPVGLTVAKQTKRRHETLSERITAPSSRTSSPCSRREPQADEAHPYCSGFCFF
jgi:hypothetical protein